MKPSRLKRITDSPIPRLPPDALWAEVYPNLRFRAAFGLLTREKPMKTVFWTAKTHAIGASRNPRRGPETRQLPGLSEERGTYFGYRDCPAQAVETSQVLNENLSEATGTAGRLSEGKPVRFPTPL